MVTAVQWLKTVIEHSRHANLLTYSSIEEAIEEALRMEKDQIEEAYIKGGVYQFDKKVEAEQYYHQTYKK